MDWHKPIARWGKGLTTPARTVRTHEDGAVLVLEFVELKQYVNESVKLAQLCKEHKLVTLTVVNKNKRLSMMFSRGSAES